MRIVVGREQHATIDQADVFRRRISRFSVPVAFDSGIDIAEERRAFQRAIAHPEFNAMHAVVGGEHEPPVELP